MVNKIDCTPGAEIGWAKVCSNFFSKHVFTCAVTGEGIRELERVVLEIVGLNSIPTGGRKWTVNQVIYHLALPFDLLHPLLSRHCFKTA